MAEKQIAEQGVLNGRHLASVIRKGASLLIRESNGKDHDMTFIDEDAAKKILEELYYCMETGRAWKFQSGPVPASLPPLPE